MRKIFVAACFLLMLAIPCDAASITKIEWTLPPDRYFTVGGWLQGSVSAKIKITPPAAGNNGLSISSSNTQILEARPDVYEGMGYRKIYVTPRSPGNVTLTIKDQGGNYSTTFQLTVASKKPGTVYVSGIVISGASNMTVGEQANLQYEITPANASNPELIWQSDAPDILAVDEGTGKITALKEGAAAVVASSTDGSVRSSNAFVVTVLPVTPTPAPSDYVPVDAMIVTGPSKMKVGEAIQMQAQIIPNNATLKDGISWYSSDSSVAMVDKNGRVTAYSQGQVMIGGKIYEHHNNTTRHIESEFGVQIVNNDRDEDNSSDSSGCNSASGFAAPGLIIFLSEFRHRLSRRSVSRKA